MFLKKYTILNIVKLSTIYKTKYFSKYKILIITLKLKL